MIIRPRLTDYYNIPLLQSEVDFAISCITEDTKFKEQFVFITCACGYYLNDTHWGREITKEVWKKLNIV